VEGNVHHRSNDSVFVTKLPIYCFVLIKLPRLCRQPLDAANSIALFLDTFKKHTSRAIYIYQLHVHVIAGVGSQSSRTPMGKIEVK